jgi:zinc protease
MSSSMWNVLMGVRLRVGVSAESARRRPCIQAGQRRAFKQGSGVHPRRGDSRHAAVAVRHEWKRMRWRIMSDCAIFPQDPAGRVPPRCESTFRGRTPMSKRLLRVMLLLLLPASAAGQSPDQRLPVDPDVTVGTLPNGLRYYIRENRRPEKRAELRLAVNAGSILEDDTQQGLAHFVEHMAFNGTRNFEKQELVSYLESIGMRFGSHLNAYTSFDETVYMLQVPTDSMTQLTTAIRILEEWAHLVEFDAAEIDKERGVVMEEWRLGQGAGERMRKQYFPTLFSNSRYADRLPIGTPEVLQSFGRDEVVRYYRDWYRPDLMAVVAVGDFDKAVVEQMIRDRFGSIPAATAPRERTLYEVPDHTETLVAIATDVEATNTIVEVDWKHPTEPDGTLGAYRNALLHSLYGRMINARFGEIMQKPDAPFLGAGSSYGNMIRTKSIYSLGAAAHAGGVERALEAVLTEGERVARHGFTASELEREKINLLRGYERAYAERDKTESAALAMEYVGAFLTDEPIPGIEMEYQLVQALLPGITVDELNALARRWMKADSRVVLVTAPQNERDRLPAESALLGVFDRVAARQIEPYIDVVANVPLIENAPAPGRIVATREVPGVDATLLELSNGAKVYLKPTTFKDDEIVMSAYSPGGLSLISDADYASGQFAAQLIAISGLGSMDQIQLQKALAGKAANVSSGPGEFSEGISGRASPRDLETMLQLVHLRFTAPRSDTTAFQSFVMRYRGMLANRDADPQTAFSDTFAVTLWQGHPRARPQNVALLDEIDQGTAFRIYRDRFANAGDFTFAFVGAFHPDTIRPLIERYIASLPSITRDDAPRDNGMRPVRGVVEKVVRKGLEPKSQTRVTFTGPFEHTRDNRLAIAALVDILDMKLRDVLREDLGGTYGVGISQNTTRFPEGRYSVSIAFGSAPDRLEELTQAVFAEIARIKENGPDADAFAKMKEQQRRGFETSQQRNEFWTSVLLREAETGESPASALDFVDRLNALTPDDVKAAAVRYLDLRNYVRVSLLPQTPAS